MGVVGFGSCIPSELRKMAVIMVRREESWFNLRALLHFMRSGDYKRAQIWCESIMSIQYNFQWIVEPSHDIIDPLGS